VTRLNNGIIGPDAQAAFDAALKINPNSPSARFYLGLNDWKSDRKAIAMETWATTYAALKDKPNAQDMLAARVAEVMSQLDRGPQDGASQGPMQGGDPAAQAAFISSMVESRAARLAANPNDIALRLSVVRVLMMTGQNAKARQALIDGVERADDNSFAIALYGAAARSVVGTSSSSTPVTKR
jgi:cytochrome c-type biogenesis protein CcmH